MDPRIILIDTYRVWDLILVKDGYQPELVACILEKMIQG